MKKYRQLTILIVFAFIIQPFFGQNNNRVLFQQDTLFLKKVDSTKIKFKKFEPLIADSVPFSYTFNIADHKINATIFDKNTGYQYTSYTDEQTWWQNQMDSVFIVETGHLIIENQFFIFVGLTSKNYWNQSDSSLFYFYNSLYCFEVDSAYADEYMDYEIKSFGLIQSKFTKINPDGTAAHFFQTIFGNPEWGYKVGCAIHYKLNFKGDSLTISGEMSCCNGGILTKPTQPYNSFGYVLYSVDPEMHMYTINGYSKNFDPLWGLNDTPFIDERTCNAININNKNNYLIWNGCLNYNSEIKKPFFYILDMELGKIVDTLTIIPEFKIDTLDIYTNSVEIEINIDTNNRIYFIYGNEYYIIDHFKSITKEIKLTGLEQIGDSLGRVCNANVFGNSMRFYSESDLCNVDSTTGIITLKLNYADIISNDNTISCIVSDGFDIDTVTISIQKPVSVRNEVALFRIFPNPCADFLAIDINSNFSNSQVSIIDLTGKILIKKSISRQITMDIDNLENGLYIVRIESKGFTTLQKILIIK